MKLQWLLCRAPGWRVVMLIHPYNFKRMFVMANVKITREHNLGIAQAMIRARGLVDGLAEQYGL